MSYTYVYSTCPSAVNLNPPRAARVQARARRNGHRTSTRAAAPIVEKLRSGPNSGISRSFQMRHYAAGASAHARAGALVFQLEPAATCAKLSNFTPRRQPSRSYGGQSGLRITLRGVEALLCARRPPNQEARAESLWSRGNGSSWASVRRHGQRIIFTCRLGLRAYSDGRIRRRWLAEHALCLLNGCVFEVQR